MNKMLKVYSNERVELVGSLQNYLKQYDIPTQIRNHYASSVMGEIGFANAWPELWVLQEHFNEAQKLLEKFDKSAPIQGPQWICDNCNEENPGTFELCWQCGHKNLKTTQHAP